MTEQQTQRFEQERALLMTMLDAVGTLIPPDASHERASRGVTVRLECCHDLLAKLESEACLALPLPLMEFHPPRWHTENTPIRKGRTPAVGCKQM